MILLKAEENAYVGQRVNKIIDCTLGGVRLAQRVAWMRMTQPASATGVGRKSWSSARREGCANVAAGGL
jgi:hypothetical protein